MSATRKTKEAESFDDNIEVEAMEGPTDKQLASISDLAERQLRQIEAVALATEALQTANRHLRQTMEVDLPNAMRAAGCTEYRLTDGTRVRIDDRYIGGKLVDPEALKWVEDHGGSSLIKTLITIEMDRGDVDKARKLIEDLRKHRFANQFKTLMLEENVHNMTIGSFVRELIERGKDVPIDKLGVRHEVSAVVGDRRPKTVDMRGIKSEE